VDLQRPQAPKEEEKVREEVREEVHQGGESCNGFEIKNFIEVSSKDHEETSSVETVVVTSSKQFTKQFTLVETVVVTTSQHTPHG
jgi:hypothetical protein